MFSNVSKVYHKFLPNNLILLIFTVAAVWKSLILLFLSLLTAIQLVSASSSLREHQQEPPEHCGLPFIRGRLPGRLVPVHYELQIELNDQQQANRREQQQQQRFFSGSVNITLKQNLNFQYSINDPFEENDSPANQLALHADPTLQILSASFREFAPAKQLIQSNSNVELIEGICRDPKSQLVVFSLRRQLKGLTGKLHIKFTGLISDDMKGLYRSTYSNGYDRRQKHQLLSTQLESVEARRVFPCFDEPALKAIFELTLVFPRTSDKQVALANWQQFSEQTEFLWDGPDPVETRIVKFAPTPPMSTYLLAFVLGEFEKPLECEPTLVAGSGTTNKSRVFKLRVFTPLGRAHEGEFALEIACKAIPLMEDYLGIQLPFQKLDLVSIPDFEAGAMENWGLITFKSSQLLVDKLDAKLSVKRTIAATVVHEIAHQWFGNLLTMNWWNDLWLNEGFATWAEFQFMDMIAPELKYRDNYLLDSHSYALREDSYRTSRPIRGNPEGELEPAAIDRLFDAISYNKAAAIVRILHDQILGPDRFKRAIRAYLNEHSYATATTENLWAALESVSKLPVRALTESWIDQAGHPLVEVELVQVGNSQPELLLRQSRFLVANPNELEVTLEERQESLWNMIISMRLFGAPDPGKPGERLLITKHVRFSGRRASIKLPTWFNSTLGSGHWIKFNANFVGFFRVSYSDHLLRMLEEPIRRGTLSLADKINLLNDALVLWQSEQLKANQYLEFLTHFEDDSSDLVLVSLVDAFRELRLLFRWQQDEQAGELLAKLDQFISKILSRNLNHLFGPNSSFSSPADHDKFEGDQHLTHLKAAHKNRDDGIGQALHLLIELQFEPAIKLALSEFSRARSLGKAPEHWIRGPAYLAVARYGSRALFTELLEGVSSESRSASDRVSILEELVWATEASRLEAIFTRLQTLDEIEDRDRLDVEPNSLLELMLTSSEFGRDFVRHLFEQQAESLSELCKGNSQLNSLASELAKSLGQNNNKQLSELLAPLMMDLDDWPSTERQLERHFAQKEARVSRNLKPIGEYLTNWLLVHGGADDDEEGATIMTTNNNNNINISAIAN